MKHVMLSEHRLRAVRISVAVATVLGILRAGQVAAQPPVMVHQEGLASWYGKREAGRVTASGTVFDPSRPTAAHRTLPLGTCVRVTRIGNGRFVVVPINDRGPYKQGRMIDLSEAAAIALDMKEVGLATVQIDVVGSCEVPPMSARVADADPGRTK